MIHNKQPRRFLAIALSVVMVLGMLPVSAAAENLTTGSSGEIIAFKKLANGTEMQEVPVGTSFDDLDLPETLTATVRFESDWSEPVQDSGSEVQKETEGNTKDVEQQPAKEEVALEDDATPSEAKQETKEPVKEEPAEEEPVQAETVLEESVSIRQSGESSEETADSRYTETMVTVPVTWTASPVYDGNIEGNYTFTAEINGFTVSAELPTITVTVGQTAVKGTVTAFDKLTDEIRWQNTTELVFPETLPGMAGGQKAQIPVRWEADHDYNPDSPESGLYVFTAQPVGGYVLDSGVEEPLITVYIPAAMKLKRSLRAVNSSSAISVAITTAAQLEEISVLVNAGRLETFLVNDRSATVTLMLANDLDLSDYGMDWNSGGGWEPIGSETHPFSGIFNGNDYEITGLYVNRPNDSSGLFGFISGAVQNLGLVNVTISGGYNTGGVAGMIESGSVTDCYVTGAVSGSDQVGGVVGGVSNGSVEYCYTVGIVSGAYSNVGGVAGSVYGGNVENCYSRARVSSLGLIGGIAGSVNSGNVKNCYATGEISGTGLNVGGVVGYFESGSVTDCIALNPRVSGGSVGRVAGNNGGTLSGNGAFSGITLNEYGNDKPVSGGTADNTDGANITSTDITTGSCWAMSSEWNNPTVWLLENGKLPVLATISAGVQDSSIPPHLEIGSGSYFLGEGSSASPYLISTPEQLAKLAELVNDSATNTAYGGKDIYYKLTADLDLSAYGKNFNSGKGWVPIGTGADNSFKGIFDGNNKKITGLTIIDRTEAYSGLFGFVGDGTVENLVLEQVNITANRNTGGLVGRIDGNVKNCGVTGTVSGGSRVGGVVAFVYTGSVTNCYTSGKVSGVTEVGGVVGGLVQSSITSCYSSSIVSCVGTYVGGITGSVGAGSVTNCYAAGAVRGSDETGGVVGSVINSPVFNCYATGTVSGDNRIGGVVGYSGGDNSKISNCAALNPSVGGLKEIGRVEGFNDGGTRSENAAFSDMMVKIGNVDQQIDSGEENNINGVNINAAAIKTDGTIGSRFSDTSIWIAENGKLPVLKGIPADLQEASLPVHLSGGSNPYFLGEGTSTDPYQIGTAEQLAKLAELVNMMSAGYADKYYQLTADIDLSGYGKNYNSGKGWVPIGIDERYSFRGSFDGNNKNITGLYINRTDNNIGLFGYLNNGTVSKLGLVEVNIGGSMSVGGVVGYMSSSSGSVTNCYVSGVVRGSIMVGGVAGWVNGSVTDCYVTGTVDGINSSIGGVAGRVEGNMTNCYSICAVSGREKVGGVVGFAVGNITNCAALNHSITGNSEVGRVVGINGGFISGNAAFSGTTVKIDGTIHPINDGAANNANGADITTAQILDSAFWNTANNWDTTAPVWDTTTVWTVADGKLPILKNAGDKQSGDGGLYLTVRNISNATVAVDDDYVYTGSPIIPSPVVTFEGGVLIKDTDYTYAVTSVDKPGEGISSGINVGTVTMTLTGKGNFAGTKTITYDIEKASQLEPGTPELADKSTSSVTLREIPGTEYRCGSTGIWQTSPSFTGLAPNTTYSFYARLKGDANHNPSPECSRELEVTTEKLPLEGTVSINPNPEAKYGDELSVTTNISSDPGALIYQWMRNGQIIDATDDTYSVAYASDIGSQISVTVTAANYSGSLTSEAIKIIKADGPPAPSTVTGEYTSAGSTFTYTVAPIADAEYRMDGGEWQESNAFINIVPESSHIFNARFMENRTHMAGASGNTGEVTFTKLDNPQVPPLSYTVSGDKNNRTITITEVSGAEYKFGDDAWGNARSKGGYSGTQTIEVQIRYEQTVTLKSSRVNSANVNVARQNQSPPPAFKLSYTYNDNTNQYIVTIPEQANAEYSFDGSTYNQTRTSTVAQGDTVTAYIRYKETDDKNQSLAVTASLTLPILPTSVIVSSAGDQSSITTKGGTLQILAAVLPAGAAQEVVWSVSGSGAVISPAGLLTATENGTVTVRATARDNRSVYGEKVITISGQTTSGDGRDASSGGSSGSGTTVNTTTTPAPENQPNPPVMAVASVASAAGINGTANANIPNQTIAEAIAKAQTDAKAQGKNGISVAVTIINPANTTALEIVLTQPVLNQLTDANVQRFEVNGQILTLSFSQKIIQQIQNQSTGDVTITVRPVTVQGVRNAYNITLSFVKDGKTTSISHFDGETITLSIPLVPGENEAAGYFYAAYVDAGGNISRIPNSVYDVNSGNIIFTTDHLSVYGVGYETPGMKITDISSHWAKESIDYILGRGLFDDNADGRFHPDTAITRGDFATALGRLAGVDTKAYSKSSFTDVKASYLPYVEWAYSKKILQGTGNSQFAPEGSITHQEMAVIFENYAKSNGYTLPVARTPVTFADDYNIVSSCKTAVKAMQQAGIIMGVQNNYFNPAGNATRAEASSMLHRYIKLTIDPATAWGWAFNNNDGKWYYYNADGTLARSRKIDGYEVDENGVRKTE